MDRQATSERSSSEEMTWLTGSWTEGPGMTSSRVGSPSEALAGVLENETYWFSGVCLLRVAVLTAVMIWRVMQSSAKLRKLDSRSKRSRGSPCRRSLSPSARSTRGLQAHEAVVTAHQAVVGRRIPLLRKGDQVTILDLNLRLRVRGQTGHERSFRPAGSHAGGLGVAQWRNPPRSAICIECSP